MPTPVPAAPADTCSIFFLALPPRQQVVRLCQTPKCSLGYRHIHRTLLSASVTPFPVGLSSHLMEALSSCGAPVSVPWRALHKVGAQRCSQMGKLVEDAFTSPGLCDMNEMVLNRYLGITWAVLTTIDAQTPEVLM